MRSFQKYRKAFIRQQGQADCGVACLASLIRYYGGEVYLERLRAMSGTGASGTTLLGLKQAAGEAGLEAKAFKADVKNLLALTDPAILHIIKDERLLHYVILYGVHNGKFIISDPAEGVYETEPDELKKLWQSQTLLVVKPGKDFVVKKEIRKKQWNWFGQLIKEDKNILSIAIFLAVVTSVLSLAVPVFSQKLIDDILPENYTTKLMVGLGLLFFLLLVRNGLAYIRQFFLLRQTKDFNNRIISGFYNRLLYLPKFFFNSRKTGDLVARMNDTLRIQNAIQYFTSNLMIDFLLVVAVSCLIFIYKPVLGVLILLYIPFIISIIYRFNNKVIRGQRKVMQSYALNESNYIDTIQGIDTIKTGLKESYFSRLTRMIYNTFQQHIFDLGGIRIRFQLMIELTGTFFMAGIVTGGAYLVLQERLELGEFMAIIQGAILFVPSAARIALTNVQLQEARVAFERMFETANVKAEYSPSEDQNKKTIKNLDKLEVKGLSFRFPGRTAILKDISFNVKKGEIITLFGETGCGKSTVLQLLQKFYTPESGSLTVNDNLPLESTAFTSWRSLTAVVPQQIKIFSGNVISNICLEDPALHAEAVMEFCREYGFDKYFEKFPNGYATFLGEEGIKISGGQQQVLALARALYQQPKLLLLDEATAAMDRQVKQFVFRLLDKIRKDMLIVMVTHQVEAAKKADRIYVIKEGTVTGNGDHEGLIAKENLYADAWKDQLVDS